MLIKSRPLISGFTFIKNGRTLGYPFIESVKSILELCDEVIINAGFEKKMFADDGTYELLYENFGKNRKVKFLHSIWNPETIAKGRGLILSEQTNIALSECKGKYCQYIQGDEVLHEDDINKILEGISLLENRSEIMGLIFRYLHFYGNVNVIKQTRNTYRREIRLIRNFNSIWSYLDAQGFRYKDGRKIVAKQIDAHIFHYGWARKEIVMNEKIKVMESLYHEKVKDPKFNYERIFGLSSFNKSHPRVMDLWIKEHQNREFDILSLKTKWEWKNIGLFFSDFIEKISDYRMGEFKNFIEFKKKRMNGLFLFIPLFLFFYSPIIRSEINSLEMTDTPAEKIYIYGERVETTQDKIGSSYSLFSKDQISVGQNQSVQTLLEQTPSFLLFSSGGENMPPSFFLRGLDQNHLLFTYNGLELGDPSSIGRIAHLESISLNSIDQVEVLRGNQSVFYGSDAAGGVIALIPKKRRGSPFKKSNSSLIDKSHVKLGYGSFNHSLLGTEFQGGGNLISVNREKQGTFTYLFNYSKEQSDEFSAALESENKNADNDGYRKDTVSTHLNFYHPDGVSTAEMDISYLQMKSDLDSYGGLGGDDPNYNLKSSQFLGNFKVSSFVDQIFSNTHMTPSIMLSFTNSRRVYDNKPNPGDYYKNSFAGRYKGEYFRINPENNVMIGDHFEITLGGDFREERSTVQETFISSTVNTTSSEKRATTSSGYLWAKLFGSSKNKNEVRDYTYPWMIKSGVRYDRHQFFGSSTSYKLISMLRLLGDSSKSESLFLKGSIGTGFKAPTLYQLFSDYGNKDLSRELSHDYEIGLLTNFSEYPKIKGELNFFRNDLNDMIEFDSKTSKYKNSKETRCEGIEVLLDSKISDDEFLKIQGSHTYLIAKDKITKNNLERRPLHQSTLGLQIKPIEKFTLLPSFQFVGKREDSTFSGKKSLPSYYLANLGMRGVVSKDLVVDFSIKNIFDKQYEGIAGYTSAGSRVDLYLTYSWL